MNHRLWVTAGVVAGLVLGSVSLVASGEQGHESENEPQAQVRFAISAQTIWRSSWIHPVQSSYREKARSWLPMKR